MGCGRDQEVYGTWAARLTAGRHDSGVHPSVGSGGFGVEGQGVECGLGALHTILPTSPLL
jgi:hypothetical protein